MSALAGKKRVRRPGAGSFFYEELDEADNVQCILVADSSSAGSSPAVPAPAYIHTRGGLMSV
jgi:hypothetical protein